MKGFALQGIIFNFQCITSTISAVNISNCMIPPFTERAIINIAVKQSLHYDIIFT